MSSNHIMAKQEEEILYIKLNRPEVLNAFSAEIKSGLIEAFSEAKASKEIRVIVIYGAGRSFSAGGDVKDIASFRANSVYEHLKISKELILAMSNLEIPIISVVHGYVAGGATGLALASDIIFAAEDSKFYFSFAKLGLVPDTSVMYFLPRTIGLYRAKELIFDPKPIKASKAMQWGMVNFVYKEERVFSEAKKYAEKLANGPQHAIGHMKKIANRALLNDLNDVLEMEATSQAILIESEDHKEGLRAFNEKDKAKFNQK